MTKAVVQKQFDYLVAKLIWPLFKNDGYRKTGNNFRLYNSLGWGKIVNFQQSAFGDRNDVSSTINTGLYLVEAEQLYRGQAAAVIG